MIVADASVLLEVLLRTEAGAIAERRLFQRRESLHAPELVDLEIAQVLRRYTHRGEVTAFRASASLNLFRRFPLERYGHAPLLPRIWELRENITAYDAAYVALAEALRAPLITCDPRLAAAPGIRAAVEVIA